MEQGTITRRLNQFMNQLYKDIGLFHTKETLKSKVKELERAKGKSNYRSLEADLVRTIRACEVECNRGKSIADYKEIIENLDIPANTKEFEERFLIYLYENYDQFATPQEYMARLVKRLNEEEWQQDSIRLRILKQFIKYADCAGYGSAGIKEYAEMKAGKKVAKKDLVEYIDEDVFLGLESATSDQKKPQGKYGLLRVVDDLASGKFKSEGATKRSLYFFAMAYGMTYYTGSKEEIRDYERDIEKNLFQEFYFNNLMRYIDDSYRNNLAAYENPNGQGINYKNFEEMVYLYFIHKEIDRKEKVKQSRKMINEITKVYKHKETKIEEQGTKEYKNTYIEDLLSLSEVDFMKYLLENYDCDGKNGSTMMINVDQNSAYRTYKELDKLSMSAGFDSQEMTIGVWFAAIDSFDEYLYKVIQKYLGSADREKTDELANILLGIHKLLITPKKTELISPKTITRTDIVSLYYYYRSFDDAWEDEKVSFNEYVKSFSEELDQYLNQAYYQPFSRKNIFDVVVAFASYADKYE